MNNVTISPAIAADRLRTATNRIAAYDWDRPSVQGLLREVSASMSDETELLQALPPRRQSTATGSRLTDTLVRQR